MKAIKSIWKEIKIKRFSYIDLVWIVLIGNILVGCLPAKKTKPCTQCPQYTELKQQVDAKE